MKSMQALSSFGNACMLFVLQIIAIEKIFIASSINEVLRWLIT